MGRAFSDLKNNIGNNVMDTSTLFTTVISVYINKRYQQILRKINWNYINEDYTVTTIAGTQDYELAGDFKNEVYCNNTTDGVQMSRSELQELVDSYPDDLTTQGDVRRYAIFNSDDGKKYIRLHYVPDAVLTIALPYIVKPAALSADVDENVLDIEDLIELGATADAWRYKRQFQKAAAMDVMFEKELTEYIWEQENQQNQVKQFSVADFDRDGLY